MGGESGRSRDQHMAGLIEKYIPGASTGARIASVPGADTAVATIDPKDLPVPLRRPTIDDDATASIAPPVPAAAPAAVAVAEVPRPAARQPAAAPTAIASLVGANSVFALDAVDQGQGDASAEDDPSDAASAGAVITGWKIQVAATPTQSSAEDILDQALGKAAAVLAKASPYTEPVVTGDTKLYRARFAGFANKNEARAACAYLTRRDFQCLALSD